MTPSEPSARCHTWAILLSMPVPPVLCAHWQLKLVLKSNIKKCTQVLGGNHHFSCSCGTQVSFCLWAPWAKDKWRFSPFLAFSPNNNKKNCSFEFEFKLMEVWGRRNRQTNKEVFYIWVFLSISWQMGLVCFTATFWNQSVILPFLCKRVAVLNLYHIDRSTGFHLVPRIIHSVVIALLFFICILLICCQELTGQFAKRWAMIYFFLKDYATMGMLL